MTDSVAGASPGCATAVIAPEAARRTPTIGCGLRTTRRPRASSSSLTESTRNGTSGVLVSTTEPAG